MRQIFSDAAEKFRREQDKLWSANETNRQRQYEAAVAEINEFKDKFGISKQEKMEQYCTAILEGLEGNLSAIIQRKTRTAGLEVIARLQEHLTQIESRLNRWKQKLIQARELFQEKADRQAESADALVINGIKLYDRQELNTLYQDAIEQFAGTNIGSKTAHEIGRESLCSTLSGDVLKAVSPLWKTTRRADEIMRLFDLTELPDVQDEDWQENIAKRTKQVVIQLPESSKLKRELTACDRLFKVFRDDAEIINNLRIAYNKSKPLILLNKAVLQGADAGFTPAFNTCVAIVGGRNTSNPTAQKLLPKLQEFVNNQDAINPLGDEERHRLIFVQEIGGFSLRCIDGMKELQKSYQDWQGEFITAKRAQQAGEHRDLPIPVHNQKAAPFWDIFPENPKIFQLVVQARALGVLRQEVNRTTGERTIRYTDTTEIGLRDVDIASSWEEAVQVLEVNACRQDKEEIQRQLQEKLSQGETTAEKQALFAQMTTYLQQRAAELEKQGGKDTPEYKREAQIILETVKAYKLKTQSESEVPELAVIPPTVSEELPTAEVALAQLERLGKLKEQGILTDEEFQIAKKRILGL